MMLLDVCQMKMWWLELFRSGDPR